MSRLSGGEAGANACPLPTPLPPPSFHFLAAVPAATAAVPAHCGANSGHFETSIIYFPTSERANERAQQRSRAKGGVRRKRTSERCERMDERVAQYLHLNSCLFQTIVRRLTQFLPPPFFTSASYCRCGSLAFTSLYWSVVSSLNSSVITIDFLYGRRSQISLSSFRLFFQSKRVQYHPASLVFSLVFASFPYLLSIFLLWLNFTTYP